MRAPRRVVTGHDSSGRGVVISDEPVRVLFVLLDGRFGDGLLRTLAPEVRRGLMHDLP